MYLWCLSSFLHRLGRDISSTVLPNHPVTRIFILTGVWLFPYPYFHTSEGTSVIRCSRYAPYVKLRLFTFRKSRCRDLKVLSELCSCSAYICMFAFICACVRTCLFLSKQCPSSACVRGCFISPHTYFTTSYYSQIISLNYVINTRVWQKPIHQMALLCH